jgi:uncharacterized membrane protein
MLLRSPLLQAVYSLLWTLLAMTLMFGDTRRAQHWMWLTGGGLLALTVPKLLIIDLSSVNTLARIVSFLGVGLLMLLIGHFAPIPPAVRIQPESDASSLTVDNAKDIDPRGMVDVAE